MDQAPVAIVGAAVGGIAATANNLIGVRAKARTDVEQKRQEMFRTACADFSAAVVSTRSPSWALKELVQGGRPGSTEAFELRAELRRARDDSQVGYERVRMLSESLETQLSARYCLRHAYAIWRKAETGTDPRAADYPGQSPNDRFNETLSAFYVESRRELGVRVPENVIAELEH